MARATLTANTVLVAVDWNNRWECTVRHAAARAEALGAALHIVHVIEPPNWLLRRVLDAATLESQNTNDRALAEEHLASARAVAPHVTVTTEVREGKPTTELLAALEATGADLLVLGTDGRDATSILLGGMTERMLRLSPVPVYIANASAPDPVHDVVVPTGLGPSGRKAIEVALGMVEGFSGKVTALHLVALPSVMRAYSGDVLAVREKIETAALEELLAHVASVNTVEGDSPVVPALETNLETVAAEQTIAARAREHDAQLICLALGGRRFDTGLFIGGVPQRLVRVLPCSLLALPDAWLAARGD